MERSCRKLLFCCQNEKNYILSLLNCFKVTTFQQYVEVQQIDNVQHLACDWDQASEPLRTALYLDFLKPKKVHQDILILTNEADLLWNRRTLHFEKKHNAQMLLKKRRRQLFRGSLYLDKTWESLTPDQKVWIIAALERGDRTQSDYLFWDLIPKTCEQLIKTKRLYYTIFSLDRDNCVDQNNFFRIDPKHTIYGDHLKVPKYLLQSLEINLNIEFPSFQFYRKIKQTEKYVFLDRKHFHQFGTSLNLALEIKSIQNDLILINSSIVFQYVLQSSGILAKNLSNTLLVLAGEEMYSKKKCPRFAKIWESYRDECCDAIMFQRLREKICRQTERTVRKRDEARRFYMKGANNSIPQCEDSFELKVRELLALRPFCPETVVSPQGSNAPLVQRNSKRLIITKFQRNYKRITNTNIFLPIRGLFILFLSSENLVKIPNENWFDIRISDCRQHMIAKTILESITCQIFEGLKNHKLASKRHFSLWVQQQHLAGHKNMHNSSQLKKIQKFVPVLKLKTFQKIEFQDLRFKQEIYSTSLEVRNQKEIVSKISEIKNR